MTRDLLVVSLGGIAYGIGKADVSSISPGLRLHRLPLSPPAMAGLAIIDGRSAAIFDLAACLGMPPRAPGSRENILLIDSSGRLTGFVVNGTVETVTAEEASLLPLPAAVRTEVIETCLVRGGSVIPIIDILKLHGRVERGDIELPAPPLPAFASSFSPDMRAIRLFTLGSGLFCMNGEGTSFVQAAQAVTPLAYAPRPVFGALSLGGAVIAAADLARPLGLEGPQEQAGLLIAPVRDGKYAFPVGDDRGMAEGGWQVLPLPPVARTDQVPAAAVRDGVIAPVVDPAAVLARSSKDERSALLAGQYHPASGFGSRFRQGSVEIVELSLLGMRHGIPKDEVKEILPVQPWRPLPGLPEIVVGVAERGGKLYPVLDLAAIFGRRSQPTEHLRMLRLSNGDFHALVLAEAVEDGRIIAPDQQRQVPISLPHQVLYGCYLDDRAVRLILNIFSLAVHFEKTEVRELIASLAPPVELPPVVRSAPEVLLPKEAVPEQPEQAPLVPLPVVPRAVEERPTDAGEARGVDERKQRDEAMVRAAAAARALEAGRKEQEEAERRAAEKAREQEWTAGEARKKAEREAAEQAEEAKRKAEAEVRRRAEEQERSRAEAEAREKTAQEARQREEEELRRYEEEQLRREEERKAAAERLAQEQERLAGAARRAEQERHAAAARLSTDTAQPPAVPAKGGRKHAIAVAVLVIAAVIAMVLLMPKSATPPEKRPAPVAETAKKEPEAQSREPAAPLVLNVPTSMPKPETVVYVVVKGDTLWGISKRFTGNPFNYPRVAKDNSIATPDLIFPGQKIQLVQEK